MVKPLSFIKDKYFSKGELVLAITMIVIAFSISAAEMKISDEEVKRVKTTLDIVNTASNFGSVLIDGGNLMTVLKTAIKGGQTATDVTYGLLVLSAINEMEFMDMVLSQDYKDEARDYFNSILDERTKLTSYWKKIGFDIPRVVSGQITGPMGALTLNTFAMTDKVISILTAFKVLETEKRYDGLWRYFDERMSGESHQGAWELAEPQMGFAAKSTSLWGTPRIKENNQSQLEQQFAELWEKWGPHATPFGISEEYKKQAKADLTKTLVTAFEENTETGSLYVEEPSLWDKFSAQLANIKNALTNIVFQINPFSAGPIVQLPLDEDETRSDRVSLAEDRPPSTEEEVAEVGIPPVSEFESEINEAQEDLDNILELVDTDEEAADVGSPPVSEPIEVVEATTTEPLSATITDESIELADVGHPPIELCQKGSAGAARQYRVLINEVAWMGDKDSPNNEWIELKNIWGLSINLSGWQIQDKDQQIKIFFGEDDVLQAGGFYLLERMKDYTGALGNSKEAVYLFDNQCNLEDEVLADPNWPAGNNSDKKTMQRFDVLNWYSQEPSSGSENLAPITPIYIFGAVLRSSEQKPAVVISYPEENPVNKEIEITLSASDFKTSLYDIKISIEKDGVLSEIYDEKKAEWQSSFYYLQEAFTGPSFTGNFKLRIREDRQDFLGKADITARVRESGKSSYSEFLGKINIIEPELAPEEEPEHGPEPDGAQQLSVVINEIAWMGTEANTADEWIELYNNTDQNIDLVGWRLVSDDNSPNIIFTSSTIPTHGYFLLERTDDNTVSNIAADKIYTGALNTEGEILELYDNFGNLIDSVNASSGWPAGNNSTKQTMERINALMAGSDSANWASNNMISRNGLDADNSDIIGTPRAQNSVSKSFTEVSTSLLVFDQDFTLTLYGSPYIMDGSIKVLAGARLIIEPGVIIKFKENYYQHSLFTVEGELETTSTVFTSYKDDEYGDDTNNDGEDTLPEPGDWDGIYFSEGSEARMNDVIVRYAGRIHQSPTYSFSAYANGSIKIDGAEVTITNSTIESSQSEGLWIINSSPQINNAAFLNNNHPSGGTALYINDENSAPVIANSAFIGNKVGIWAGSGAAPVVTGNVFKDNETPIKILSSYPYFSENSADNNLNSDGILFEGGIFQDTEWQADLPYIIKNDIIVAADAELSLESGVIVKLSGARITIQGNLLAQGNEDNKIIFTSFYDDEYGGDTNNDGESSGGPGQWKYIYFGESSQNSLLEYVVVKYGGFTGSFGSGAPNRGAITIEDAFVEISTSTIENNFFAGAYLNNSDSKIRNTVFRDNKVRYSDWGIGAYSIGLYLVDSPDVDLSGSRFEKNYQGIYIAGGCPDLRRVSFGEGDDANTDDIYPDTCKP